MRDFGRHIKRRRLQLGLTQKEVSRAVSRSHGWLSALEKGDGKPEAETITGLAVKLGEDPKDYLRMTGRAVLTAEDVIPSRVSDLPPETAAAVERAVAAAISPLVDRIDRLLELLEQRRDGA
jgi:transcriptional regulator with XRE-family HTH domain